MGKTRGVRFYNHIYARTGAYDKSLDLLPWWELYCGAAAWAVGAGRDVVDLGCGPGHLASLLALLPHSQLTSYVGLDFSGVAIRQARARVPDPRFNFLRRNLETVRLRFALGRAIVASELFEHLEFDRDLLQRLPGGCPIWFSVARFNARGHVRHFEEVEEAQDRYGDLIAQLRLVPLKRFIVGTGYIKRWGRGGRGGK